MQVSAVTRSSCANLQQRVRSLGTAFERSYSRLKNQNQSQKVWWKAKGSQFDLGDSFHFRSTSSISDKGEIMYRQALQLMKEADELEKKREQERSTMMYKAWQKSQETNMNPKSQGVTLVKTLAKDVRKARKNDDDSDKRGKILELLKHAATKYYHPEAAIQVGNILLKEASRGIHKNGTLKSEAHVESRAKDLVNQAMELFRQAGNAGSRVGWYNLGHLAWTGFPPPKVVDDESEEEGTHSDFVADNMEKNQIIAGDIDEAMNAFNKAIDLGDSDAMYLVGVNQLGQGGGQGYRDAIRLIERAADIGHSGALYYLALLHLNGEPEIELESCSLEDFMQRLDSAVEAGSIDARFVRANSFYHGTEGYPQNFKKALNDFLQAADEGHADAAVSAGAMLHNGVGVLKDQRKAFELYQLGGELGSKAGWMNVVDCWQQGLGVQKSEETARYIKETILKEIT